MNAPHASRAVLDLARRVLKIEADAVRALAARLDERFLAAVSLILERRGRVLVSGIGKSGHIARKVASTMASTGTPAYFVHPAEASHGDLGMIEDGDVFIAISQSGRSEELLAIVPLVKRRGAKLIALTGDARSALARDADVCLDTSVAQEACPLNLSPTASTTAALALGDALAVALLDARGFSAHDYSQFHPRGQLHSRATLLIRVRDVMRTKKLPCVPESATLVGAVREMTRGRMGMTAVLDRARRVRGIFTDGDLRRLLEKSPRLGALRISQVMTRRPKVIRADALAGAAVRLMERHKVNQLLVVDAAARLVGALNMHDLFRAKVL